MMIRTCHVTGVHVLMLYLLRAVAKMSMYAGVLSLGIGDAIASIVGKLHGKHNWPGTWMYV